MVITGCRLTLAVNAMLTFSVISEQTRKTRRRREEKEGGEGGTSCLLSPVPSLLVRSLSLAVTACPLECRRERKCLSQGCH